MKTIPVGHAATIEFPLLDLNGAAVEPTGLAYELRDQEGELLLPAMSLTVTPGMTIATVQIPAEHNDELLAPIEARVVVLHVTSAAGVQALEQIYLVAKSSRLEVMSNSFQTLATAAAEAAQMPNLLGWDAATDPERTNAMFEAFLRLTRLGYRIRRPEDIDFQNVILDFNHNEIIEPRLWPLIDKDRWFSTRYPEIFRAALRRAQIAEANEILRGDRINEKRRSGIMSETIGESSMMFRVGKPLDLGISASALHYVTGYVQTRLTVTRA